MNAKKTAFASVVAAFAVVLILHSSPVRTATAAGPPDEEAKASRSGHWTHAVRPRWLVRPSLRGSCCRIARVQTVSQRVIPNEDG
jgi:hypothetical protein